MWIFLKLNRALCFTQKACIDKFFGQKIAVAFNTHGCFSYEYINEVGGKPLKTIAMKLLRMQTFLHFCK
jgi:hypothetical protein